MLLPHLMRGVVENGANDIHDPVFIVTRQLLALAESEAILGVPEKDCYKLSRRMLRAEQEVIGAYQKEGASVAKVGLILYYLLSAMTECDYLTLHPGSPMDQALEKILPALEPSANIVRLDQSAKKASRKVLKHFQTLGYFRGVLMEEDNG